MPHNTAHKRNVTSQPAPLGKVRNEAEQREYLRERYGIDVSKRTLQDWRVRGCGPPFRRSGKTPLYEEYDTEAWVLRRLGRVHRSTAEEQAQRHLVDTAAA